MRNQLLLLEDVADVGISGEVVSVKPGFARNFLLPQKKAIVATKGALQFQAKLKEKRAQKALVDKAESERYADSLKGKEFKVLVKVDPDGRMYGSVNAHDVTKLLEKEGIVLEKRSVQLPSPLKVLGDHLVQLKLKEGVMVQIMIKIESETPIKPKAEKETAEKEEPTVES